MEQQLNFPSRAEISARIVGVNYYPMANNAADEFIESEIFYSPAVQPGRQRVNEKCRTTVAPQR